MTTHQPPSQPSYLDSLAEISIDIGAAFDRVHSLLSSRPAGTDEWNDIYHVQTALHLASQLANDAADRERARLAPVPFLPVDIEAAAAQLAAALGRLTADKAIEVSARLARGEGWDGS